LITAFIPSKYLLTLRSKAESNKLHVADTLAALAKSNSVACLSLLIRRRMIAKDNGAS